MAGARRPSRSARRAPHRAAAWDPTVRPRRRWSRRLHLRRGRSAPFTQLRTGGALFIGSQGAAGNDIAGNDLTRDGFVFNKYVKYGYALPDLLGARRSHPPRDPGAARHGGCHGGRHRRAVRHVAAGGVAASESADRRRPDREPHRGAVATLRAARRRAARRRRLDRGIPPLLGAAVRQARGLPQAHGTERPSTKRQKRWPQAPLLTTARWS